MSKKKQVRKWLRIIHRDLGYLVVGLSLIYGISGFLLNHMDGKDPAYKTVEEKLDIAAHLSEEDLLAEWNARQLPEVRKVSYNEPGFAKIMLSGGIGIYNQNTGELAYEYHRKRPFVYYINKFHYNRAKNWLSVADFFAFSLIFLAISGMFIVPKKKGLMGRGKWFVLAGLLVPILWVIFGG